MIVSLLAVYRGTDIVSSVVNQITAFAIVYYSMILLIASGVASEKILVMPLRVCPKLTRRHHGWRRARKFFKFRASRSSETAFSDMYLFIFVGTIWSI